MPAAGNSVMLAEVGLEGRAFMAGALHVQNNHMRDGGRIADYSRIRQSKARTEQLAW